MVLFFFKKIRRAGNDDFGTFVEQCSEFSLPDAFSVTKVTVARTPDGTLTLVEDLHRSRTSGRRRKVSEHQPHMGHHPSFIPGVVRMDEMAARGPEPHMVAHHSQPDFFQDHPPARRSRRRSPSPMTHPFGEDHGFNGGISHRQMHMRAPSHGFDGGQQFDEDDEPHMGPVSRMPSDFRGNHRSNSAFHMDQPSPNDFHENRGFNGAPPPHMGIRAPGSRFSHDDHGFNPAFPQSHMGPGPPTLGRNSSFQHGDPYGAPHGAHPYGPQHGGNPYGSQHGSQHGASPYSSQHGASPYGSPHGPNPYGSLLQNDRNGS